MSLKSLIKNQTVSIDDHKYGASEFKNWDDPSVDVHIHKMTLTRIDGKYHEVVIKVPVNSNRAVQVTSNKKSIPVPRLLRKEIISAFNNKSTRENFIHDMVKILKNFKSNTSNKMNATQALENVAKHFGLDWTDKRLGEVYEEAMYNRYVREMIDVDGKRYRLSIDDERIEVKDNSAQPY